MDWITFNDEVQPNILFHSQEIDFQLEEDAIYKAWIERIVQSEKHQHGEINYIFCNDAYLLEKNQIYLQHDTLTDIITFEYSKAPITGDIFISIERVKENAKERNLTFKQELHRVMAHGILHLCGYGDKKEEEIKIMRSKEEACMLMLSEDK